MPYSKCELPEYPCTSDMWDKIVNDGRPIVVYGMGNGADKLIRRLAEYGVDVADFFASDGFVRGHCFHGKRVKSFSEIKEAYPDFLILLSFASSRDEVIEMLSEINEAYDMLVPDMPVVGEEYFDRAFFNENYEKIREAYELLSDEDSRRAYAAIINYRLSGKMSYLMGAYSGNDEIYSLISDRRDVRTYIDAGAYNGDTLREAIRYFPSLERAFAIEPDLKNFKKLSSYALTVTNPKITLFNAAAWCDSCNGIFNSSGNRNSSVSGASYEHKAQSVELLRIDSLTADSVDYIKYDVEGAEAEALLGSHGIIESSRPVLLVSLYHLSRDIFALPLYLSRTYGGYEFYLRRQKCLPAWEVNLIAVPKS